MELNQFYLQIIKFYEHYFTFSIEVKCSRNLTFLSDHLNPFKWGVLHSIYVHSIAEVSVISNAEWILYNLLSKDP